MYLLCCASVTQSCPTLCDPVDCSPPGTYVHRDSPGKNTGVGCHDFLQKIFLLGFPNPGIKTRSPALQADSLLSKSPRKPISQCSRQIGKKKKSDKPKIKSQGICSVPTRQRTIVNNSESEFLCRDQVKWDIPE